jgi:hypothetical protein
MCVDSSANTGAIKRVRNESEISHAVVSRT